MKLFKPKYKIKSHYSMQNGVAMFYAVNKRRWLFIFPYWSMRPFKTSNDYCYTEYETEANEIIKGLINNAR